MALTREESGRLSTIVAQFAGDGSIMDKTTVATHRNYDLAIGIFKSDLYLLDYGLNRCQSTRLSLHGMKVRNDASKFLPFIVKL